MSDIRIKALLDSDVPKMVAMIEENLDPFQEAGSVLASAYRRLKNFRQIYGNEGSLYLAVYDRQNQLIGGAGLGPFAGLSPKEKIGEIRELVIAPQFRNRGIGAQLLKEALRHAKSMGYQRIYLETTPQMHTAQKLFRRFSFSPVTQSREAGWDSKANSEAALLPCYYMYDDPEASLANSKA